MCKDVALLLPALQTVMKRWGTMGVGVSHAHTNLMYYDHMFGGFG